MLSFCRVKDVVYVCTFFFTKTSFLGRQARLEECLSFKSFFMNNGKMRIFWAKRAAKMDSTHNFGLEKVWLQEILCGTQTVPSLKDFSRFFQKRSPVSWKTLFSKCFSRHFPHLPGGKTNEQNHTHVVIRISALLTLLLLLMPELGYKIVLTPMWPQYMTFIEKN